MNYYIFYINYYSCIDTIIFKQAQLEFNSATNSKNKFQIIPNISIRMEVAPHSPSISEPSTVEPMKTDLPPKRPLEDDSTIVTNTADSDQNSFNNFNTNNTQDYNRLKRPAKRVLRRARAHPTSAARTWNVFVGDLRSEVTEADLLHAFSGCGPINSVHIVRDSLTGQQRGFGFIHFKTAEAQLNALKVRYNTMHILSTMHVVLAYMECLHQPRY